MPPASLQAAAVSRRPFGQNYAFVVVAVIFLALLASAGLRATPGVLMLPLQAAFGWDVGVISSSAAVGIFLYGLAGPFAAAVMQRFGIRRTVLGALAGAYAGNQAEKSIRAETVYTVDIQMDVGGSRSITVKDAGGLSVGSKVRVNGDNITPRG